MAFHTRNAYYLRISSNNVLPLYLYLDERHLDWMSDRVLQHVLADLRPVIIPKLQAEVDAHLGPGGPANAKKGTVDVKRGDFYQFAYFLRKTEPHSVLIKARTFSAAPQLKQTVPASKTKYTRTQNGKRKPTAIAESPRKGRKKRKTKGKGIAEMEDSDEELAISSGDNGDLVRPDSHQLRGDALRRSSRTKKLVAGGYRQDDKDHSDADAQDDTNLSIEPWITSGPPIFDDQMRILEQRQSREQSTTVLKEESREESFVGLPDTNSRQPLVEEGEEPIVEAPEIELVVDEEDTKAKPLLQLKYQGFNIFGNCLCVVVEPWPPIQNASRAPSIAPIFDNTARAPSIAPSDFTPSGQAEATHRERTPLFLPDPDRSSKTPAPFNQPRVLPPVPLFNDPPDQGMDDINEDSLMAFSQALNYAGDYRGGVEEDDEMDGAVFLGDADEAREF